MLVIHVYLSFMYPCIHVYLYSCLLVFMSACIHVCLYSCIPVFMSACIHVYLVFMYACIHVYLYSCMPVFKYACIHVYLYSCLLVFMSSCTHWNSLSHIQSVTKQFGQNSKSGVHLQHNRPPAPPVQCCVWKYLRKMFPASAPTLFRVGEGGIVFYAEQYLEIRRYVHIISLSKNLLSLIVGSCQNIVSYI
jgi:hypothetical protein